MSPKCNIFNLYIFFKFSHKFPSKISLVGRCKTYKTHFPSNFPAPRHLFSHLISMAHGAHQRIINVFLNLCCVSVETVIYMPHPNFVDI